MQMHDNESGRDVHTKLDKYDDINSPAQCSAPK